MRHISRFILIVAGAGLVSLLVGCGTTARVPAGGPYHVTAYRPNDPSAVRVKVSLDKENIYVMEGDRCLMAVACCGRYDAASLHTEAVLAGALVFLFGVNREIAARRRLIWQTNRAGHRHQATIAFHHVNVLLVERNFHAHG